MILFIKILRGCIFISISIISIITNNLTLNNQVLNQTRLKLKLKIMKLLKSLNPFSSTKTTLITEEQKEKLKEDNMYRSMGLSKNIKISSTKPKTKFNQ